MTPTKARIAAALRLAEALTEARRVGWTLPTNLEVEHDAYRATLPKLRRRADVDADHVRLARDYYEGRSDGREYDRRYRELCSEPIAPEPAAEAEPCDRLRKVAALLVAWRRAEGPEGKTAMLMKLESAAGLAPEPDPKVDDGH